MKKFSMISLFLAILNFIIGLIILVSQFRFVFRTTSIRVFSSGLVSTIKGPSLSIPTLMPIVLIIIGSTLIISALLFLIISIILSMPRK